MRTFLKNCLASGGEVAKVDGMNRENRDQITTDYVCSYETASRGGENGARHGDVE
jgi:hypothetical protein